MEYKINNIINRKTIKNIGITNFPVKTWNEFKARCTLRNMTLKEGLIKTIKESLDKERS